MKDVLCAVVQGRLVGRLVQKDGRSRLTYESAWQQTRGAFPVSLSMPLAANEHSAPVDAYLWGLLPDNPRILEAWGKTYQVSSRNAFRILQHVGEDCPGALQLCSEARLPAVLSPDPAEVEWLDEADIERRIALLKRDHAAWNDQRSETQFSLAGAQPKTALYWNGARWAIPNGRAATTHILKPGIPGLNGSIENEYFCLELARAVGLPVASTHVQRFGTEAAIVVERYDRVLRTDGSVLRIHQEDLCQAMGLEPGRKYQNDGGPSPVQVVQLLRQNSIDPVADVATFIRALIFNWLILGTDAHAKNYALLFDRGAEVRLAPLYDVASALPYRQLDQRRIKLAMKIGGKYRVREIGRHQWQKLAREVNVPEDWVFQEIAGMVRRLPRDVRELAEHCAGEGLLDPVLTQLETLLVERVSGIARELGL